MEGTDAESLRLDGNSLFRQGCWNQAAEKYTEALEKLGVSRLCSSGGAQTALAWQRKAPKTPQPANRDTLLACASNIAACALQLGDPVGAWEHCEFVLALDTSHLKARYRKALALIRGRGHLCDSSRLAFLTAHWELTALEERGLDRASLQTASAELYDHARAEGVKLPPLRHQCPAEFSDLGYLHAQLGSTDGADREQSLHTFSDDAGVERNLMLVLHGFGGRRQSFVDVFHRMRLPKTAVVLVNGPSSLPAELLDDPPGYSWFTMLTSEYEFIKPGDGNGQRLRTMQSTCDSIEELIEVFVAVCGWKADEIFFFGYGQGGSVALDLVLRPNPSRSLSHDYAAVVGVATEVLPERLQQLETAGLLQGDLDVRCGAVLLIHGERDQIADVSAVQKSAMVLEQGLSRRDGFFKLRMFPDRGGEMLRGHHEEESRCFMEFLSDYLHGVGRKGSEEAMRKLGAEPVTIDAWLSQLD